MDLTIHVCTDLPFQGVNFTWTNNRSNEEAIYERIDKAFSNSDWRNSYPNAETWNLPILLSDHIPIILHLQEINRRKGSRPYRLDAWSLNHEEVRNIIKEEWTEIQDGSSSFILQRKLQKALRRIRNWCVTFKARNNIDWKEINSCLSEYQKGIANTHQAESDQNNRNQVISSIDMKTQYWKQRAKSRWDECGDSTSSSFYKSVKSRSVRNTIKAIKDHEGNWIMDHPEIKNIFLSTFKDLYQPVIYVSNPILPEDPFLALVQTLPQHHLDILNTPFTNDEIKKACFCSKPLKSLGPDGVPPIFFQKN